MTKEEADQLIREALYYGSEGDKYYDLAKDCDFFDDDLKDAYFKKSRECWIQRDHLRDQLKAAGYEYPINSDLP